MLWVPYCSFWHVACMALLSKLLSDDNGSPVRDVHNRNFKCRMFSLTSVDLRTLSFLLVAWRPDAVSGWFARTMATPSFQKVSERRRQTNLTWHRHHKGSHKKKELSIHTRPPRNIQ